MLVNCPNCKGEIEIPRRDTAAQVLNISLPPAPEKPKPPPQQQPRPELHTINVGGRTIVLPAPEDGCKRSYQLGPKLPVPFSWRRRLVAFFVAEDTTPMLPRYFYVQCLRFGAGTNETLTTYARLQQAVVKRDQKKAYVSDLTDDSVCWWKDYESQNLIATSCMMLVRGRVLHLYGVSHQDLNGFTIEDMVMKSWRDRIRKANP